MLSSARTLLRLRVMRAADDYRARHRPRHARAADNGDGVRGSRMTLVRHRRRAHRHRPGTRLPAPGYLDETCSVGRCLRVVMKEECEHRPYAVRDLAVLEQT